MNQYTPCADDLIFLSGEIALLLGSDTEAFTRIRVKHNNFSPAYERTSKIIEQEETLVWLIDGMQKQLGDVEHRLTSGELLEQSAALHAIASLLHLNDCPIEDLQPEAFKDLHGPLGFLLSAICDAVAVLLHHNDTGNAQHHLKPTPEIIQTEGNGSA